MRPIQRLLAIFLIAVLCPLSAQAGTAVNPEDYFYVAPKDLPAQLLPPPPAANSTEALNEAEAVIVAQKHLSKNDLQDIRNEQHIKLETITDIMGENFTRARLPKTFSLLDHVLADTQNITEADKEFWHVKRPYLVNHNVKLLVDPIDNSPAYPSGHTSESRVIAEILGLLCPDRLAALRARAASIAWHRVEAGVHYPADIEAGRMLAMQIIGAMMENEDFQIDFLTARDEIARVH